MDINQEKVEVFNSLRDYVPRFLSGIEIMINSIHSENENDFLNMMINAIEGLDWIIKAMSTTGDFYSDVSVENVNEVLKELLQAFENKDYTLVADIFEYEIHPMITKWGNCITSTHMG